MNAPTKHQIITDEAGKPAFAVIPYPEYLKLIDSAPAADDEDENVFIPHEVVKAHMDGDSMVKAWREHLGLTQQEVADRMATTQPNFAKWERPDATPRKSTLKKIAEAMGIDPAQLEV